MNKPAIKNFAIWARKKLIADITYKAGLMGVTEKGINNPLPQSTKDVQFFDIGTKEPYSIAGTEIEQRRNLVDIIQKKEKQSDYKTAYNSVIEEVAYTWFNRLIAVRFMEVNDYLPSRIRVLSSESSSKIEPDLVTSPFDADLEYTPYEKDKIIQLKNDNKLDELFRMLFIKQCNALNAILPELFQKTNDHTELLMNVSFTDKDGVVYRLVHDIPEDDFNVEKEGQVEIIGWLYQYYNTELNELVYDGNMSKSRIPKELLPAATTIYTPDWAIQYMIENGLGRLWLDNHPSSKLISHWKYYIADVGFEQGSSEPDEGRIYNAIKPEDIKLIDPCMGSGHILVRAFDILMQIYESHGYSQRDAAINILKYNLFGLDIDNRAYQISYFAVMMKARQYNRRIFNTSMDYNIHVIQDSNEIHRDHLHYFGHGMNEIDRNAALIQIERLLDSMKDAKEYGSIIKIDELEFELINQFINNVNFSGQISFDTFGLEFTQNQLRQLVETAEIISQKYDVVVTNPPYLGSSRFSPKLLHYVNEYYFDVKSDLSMVMFKKSLVDFSKVNGFVAFITTNSWMSIKSFESLREYVLKNTAIESIVDFGTELFEGKVGHNPIVAWVCRNQMSHKRMVGVRLVDFCYSRRDEKQKEFFNQENYYYPKPENFSKIPGMPIAYWVSESLLNAFTSGKPLETVAEPKKGLTTANDAIFLRHWSEVSHRNCFFNANNSSEAKNSPKKWFPVNKGGDYRKWYGNNEFVINWEFDGNQLRQYKNAAIRNTDYYFRENITWNDITSKYISFRYKEKGHIFNDAGPSIFGSYNVLLYLLGLGNSHVARKICSIIAPTIHYGVGQIAKTPIIFSEVNREKVEKIVEDNITISKIDWDSVETSWNFISHPFVQFKGTSDLGIRGPKYSIPSSFQAWENFTNKHFYQLKANEEELNRIFIEIYGLENELSPEVEDKDVTIGKADLGRDVRSFISYAIGCLFGRYSLDVEGLAYAGGEWDDSKYSTFIPDKDNVIPITDEQYFEDDIVGLFCAFLKKTFEPDTLEENLDFIAKALGNKGNTSREVIRNYFLKDFFKDHCKVYQKRPIYWLFDSGKEDGFKALIYMHRYNEDTIGNLRIDYLHRMQRVYESEITRMQDTIDNSNNAREVAAATKRKEKLIRQLKETKEYDEKIAHLALARIPIDLDDGVKVNYDKVQTGTDGKKLDVLAKI